MKYKVMSSIGCEGISKSINNWLEKNPNITIHTFYRSLAANDGYGFEGDVIIWYTEEENAR